MRAVIAHTGSHTEETDRPIARQRSLVRGGNRHSVRPLLARARHREGRPVPVERVDRIRARRLDRPVLHLSLVEELRLGPRSLVATVWPASRPRDAGRHGQAEHRRLGAPVAHPAPTIASNRTCVRF